MSTDEPEVIYFCPACKSTRLTITAVAEFEFDGEDHTTGPGIGVEWDDTFEAECRDCHTEFVLANSCRPRES
jgi:Zn finger protein HypA/HybF involved in hydrogenase expression